MLTRLDRHGWTVLVGVFTGLGSAHSGEPFHAALLIAACWRDRTRLEVVVRGELEHRGMKPDGGGASVEHDASQVVVPASTLARARETLALPDEAVVFQIVFPAHARCLAVERKWREGVERASRDRENRAVGAHGMTGAR